MDKRLASELIKTRKAVKKKYESLKADIAESQTSLAEHWKPLAQPLKELISTIKTEGVQSAQESDVTKQSPKVAKHTEPAPIPTTPTHWSSTPIRPKPTFLKTDVVGEIRPVDLASEEEVNNDEEEVEYSDDTYAEAIQTVRQLMRSEVIDEYLDQYQGLARQYIEDMIRDTEGKFDQQYGVRFNLETNKFHIGNKEVDFDGQDIYITDGGNRVTYKGTPGFYELMFKKNPIGYTQADKEQYKDIVKRSAANRLNYNPTNKILGNGGKKYSKVVKHLEPKGTPKAARKGGAGLFRVNNKKIEYVPWKDPNTLVDRLRILIASQVAGHTGHNNEIVSLIEALKTEKVIA